MSPLVVYALAVGVGIGMGWAGWWLISRRAQRPQPASVALDDPALTCGLIPPEKARGVIGDRTLWMAEGPTHDRSALIYPHGNLALLLEVDHPDEQVLVELRRLLTTTRADYVLVHSTEYYPIGIALRPAPKDARLQSAKEQLAQLAGCAGLQVLWLPHRRDGDIDDVVMAIINGALAPIPSQTPIEETPSPLSN